MRAGLVAEIVRQREPCEGMHEQVHEGGEQQGQSGIRVCGEGKEGEDGSGSER